MLHSGDFKRAAKFRSSSGVNKKCSKDNKSFTANSAVMFNLSAPATGKPLLLSSLIIAWNKDFLLLKRIKKSLG